MLEELGFRFWQVLLPSRKGFEAKKAFYLENDVDSDKIQDEWCISTFGLIVWLCVWSYTQQTNGDKERARSMKEAFFARLLHPATWFHDRIVRRHEGAITEYDLQTTPDQPCRCMKYLMKGISNELASWKWGALQTLIVDLIFVNFCASDCAFANALPKEISFYCDAGVLSRQPCDPIRDARQPNGPGANVGESTQILGKRS